MNRYSQTFEDIPGTTIFDSGKSRMGYHLSVFCMSLMKAENRISFKADEPQYLDNFLLTNDQREAILSRDYNRMIELGGNIFFLARIGATDGRSVLAVVASMSGLTQDEYMNMMLSGGRPIKGNRSLHEWKCHG